MSYQYMSDYELEHIIEHNKHSDDDQAMEELHKAMQELANRREVEQMEARLEQDRIQRERDYEAVLHEEWLSDMDNRFLESQMNPVEPDGEPEQGDK